MRLIKRKSLIVALVSSAVIALVMVITLVGYFVYLEYKGKEFARHYQEMLQKAKARVYSGYISIGKLDARIENTGALKGKPIIEGVIKNTGTRDVSDLAIDVSFIDKDGAVIYQTWFHPQEPSIPAQQVPYFGIPYLKQSPRTTLKAGEEVVFKRVMYGCPTEIFIELREGEKPKKTFGRWSGRLQAHASSLDF
jgi:hypothetical protein